MPLKKARGRSKKSYRRAVSSNIHELVHHGKRKRSMKQIIAIAIHAAKSKKKKR